jgi:hypothetical protein
MIEINLIPDVKRELIRAQIQRNAIVSIAIIVAIGAGVIVVLMALYVYGAQAYMMKKANDDITSQYNKLTSVQDLDKMLTIQNQLKTVSSLNDKKYVNSRLYDILNVIVPSSPHSIMLSSVSVGASSDSSGDSADASGGDGIPIQIEGQAAGSYASLEVFEKTIAAAVIEYKPNDGYESKGDLSCGSKELECRYLTAGGGDRSAAITVSEMSFGENQEGAKTLFFKLSFTVAPEALSNQVSNVRIKIGKDGNVTDSYLGVPRAIFEARPSAKEEGK